MSERELSRINVGEQPSSEFKLGDPLIDGSYVAPRSPVRMQHLARRSAAIATLMAAGGCVSLSYDAYSTSVEGSSQDCAFTVPSTADLPEYNYLQDFIGTYNDIIETKSLSTQVELRGLVANVSLNTETAEETFDVVREYMHERGIELLAQPTAKNRAGVYQELSTINVMNLVKVMHRIPRSMYDYVGASIELVPAIEIDKSREQIETEQSKNPGNVVLPYETIGGAYYPTLNRIRIPFSSLDKTDVAGLVLTHEYIGHAVMGKLCDPKRDTALQAINTSAGIDFVYTPEWKRKAPQEALYSSGILFARSYGGTTLSEDVATTAELFMTFTGRDLREMAYDSKEDAIADDKARLVFFRLLKIEPDLGIFLAHNSARAS